MNVGRDRRPLALQVRDEIQALIVNERLGPGDQLPGEAELASRFAVARTTVREALKLLEQDGQIAVHHGRGRFVATQIVHHPITRLQSVTDMMASLGFSVENRVLDVREAPATDEQAEALRLAPGTPVVIVERLRLHVGDPAPLIYSVDVVPRSILAEQLDQVDWSGSLAALLEAHGVAMSYASARFRATTLPEDVAHRVGEDPRAPWLLLIQLNMTEDGRPIVFSYDYHRGTTFTFNVLRRAEPHPARS
jgi:GntR family transcriptional regulator